MFSLVRPCRSCRRTDVRVAESDGGGATHQSDMVRGGRSRPAMGGSGRDVRPLDNFLVATAGRARVGPKDHRPSRCPASTLEPPLRFGSCPAARNGPSSLLAGSPRGSPRSSVQTTRRGRTLCPLVEEGALAPVTKPPPRTLAPCSCGRCWLVWPASR